MKITPALILIAATLMLVSSCKPDKKDDDNNPPKNDPPVITDTTTVAGYNLLTKITGIWAGPVTSSTALGNFPEYTADYRPISAAQVSAKNELDKNNDLFMSFFIVWHCNQYKIAFRNGGYFSGMQRISYLVIDSVSETGSASFYRFTDFKAGKARSYADLLFKGDSLYMKVYTNKYNSQPQAVIHFSWDAGRQDNTAAQTAATHFGFPKKERVKNMCNSFDGKTESIFYDPSQDVYPENTQPYLGKTTVNVTLPGTLDTTGKRVFLIVTTQPLFNGFTPQLQNLKYKSRYVIMPATDKSFVFNYMHPGSYYLYGLFDKDGNNTFSSGDYIAVSGTNLNTQFSLGEKEQKTVQLNLNTAIP